jgi:hypothetical protein
MLSERKLRGDAAQLLSVLDSYDFARFMGRYASARRVENYRAFADPAASSVEERAPDPALDVLQWQNVKAVARTKRSLPVLESRQARPR